MKRRDLMTGLAAAALSGAARAAPRPGQALRFAPYSDLALLDPVQTSAFVTRNHACLVHDMLYGMGLDLRPRPQMVAGHVVEDDGKRWTLTLRDGLRFHDGTPVLARDVVASLKRWGAVDQFGGSLFAVVDDLSAASDKQVVFRMARPFRLLPDALGKPGPPLPVIVPERLARIDGRTQVTEVVGCGPYRFVAGERVPGSRAVYERFDGYVPRAEPPDFLAGGKVAGFDRVEWLTLPDPSTAAAALQSGEIDWWELPTTDLLPLLRRRADIAVEVLEEAGSIAVLRFNHLQPPFDNPAIRRALLPAISQADFMTAAAGEDHALWRDGVGFFLPGSPAASEAGMAALTGPRDLDKARRALRDAGYKGERVVLLVPTDTTVNNAMSEVAGDVLRRIGINLDYQAQDWGTVAQRLNSKEPLDRGGWSLTCNSGTGFGASSPAAHTWLRGQGYPRSNWGFPTSPEIERLRQAWFDAPGPAEQKSLCERLQVQAFEDLPYIPLGLFYRPTAYRRTLTGMLKGLPLFYGVRRAG